MSPIEKNHSRGLNGALAAEIRAEMAVQEVSGHKLAELAGIDRLTLRRYTKGERALSTATIEAVARALGVDPGELMLRAVQRRDANPGLYGTVSDGAATLRGQVRAVPRASPCRVGLEDLREAVALPKSDANFTPPASNPARVPP